MVGWKVFEDLQTPSFRIFGNERETLGCTTQRNLVRYLVRTKKGQEQKRVDSSWRRSDIRLAG